MLYLASKLRLDITLYKVIFAGHFEFFPSFPGHNKDSKVERTGRKPELLTYRMAEIRRLPQNQELGFPSYGSVRTARFTDSGMVF